MDVRKCVLSVFRRCARAHARAKIHSYLLWDVQIPPCRRSGCTINHHRVLYNVLVVIDPHVAYIHQHAMPYVFPHRWTVHACQLSSTLPPHEQHYVRGLHLDLLTVVRCAQRPHSEAI